MKCARIRVSFLLSVFLVLKSSLLETEATFSTVQLCICPYTFLVRAAMETGYTCLRCCRALSRSSTSVSKQVVQFKPFNKRSFSSTIQKYHQPVRLASSISTEKVTAPKTITRAASQAAARKEEPDNFERHVQLPNDFGDYHPPRHILRPDNLFHPFSESPVPQIRQRALYTKQHAYCPHPAHQQTRVPTSPHDPEARKQPGIATLRPAHVEFECPDCGIATYCNEEHWAADYEAHLEICDTLKQINEDDHDLRSGRWFPEFEYPGPQLDEILVNMTSWDTFLYTRQFEAINEDRSMRQATRLLTYPLTVGSVLHELSPYSIRRGGRLTSEGLKSLSGRCNVHEG
jgi:splicing suppressor protein 51